jgi:hypothetical protein
MWFSQRLINIICVICFYILFFSLENVIDELLKKLGEYLLINDVKFITSGTIRYNVITNKTLWTPVAHVKVMFSLFLERVSKQWRA